LGKIGGAYLGAVMAKSPKVVKHNTGLCLLSQGGVEIGMLVAVSSIFPADEAIFIKTVVLAGILFFEIVGPIVFKYRIEKIGESNENKDVVITDVSQLGEAK
jgi:hypothetical protein